jgi:rubrerythrin
LFIKSIKEEYTLLSDPEMINNALKQALHMEEITAKKYAEISKSITKPQLQTMLKGMEMATRNNYSMISKKMSDMAMI